MRGRERNRMYVCEKEEGGIEGVREGGERKIQTQTRRNSVYVCGGDRGIV